MRLSHWLALIATLVGLGCLQVAQHNAIFLSGYAAGERLSTLRAKETEVGWWNAQVTGRRSPVALDQAAQERQLNLVAWSTWRPDQQRVPAQRSPTPVAVAGADTPPSRGMRRLASVDPLQSIDDGDTSD